MFSRLFSARSPQPDNDQVRFVDPATVREWLEAGEAVLIDVREANEFAGEHIPGALFNPLSGFDPAKVPPPGDKKLVIHCRSGARCGMAASRLQQAGYTGTIHRMLGGIMAWKTAGGGTTRGG